MKIIKFCAVSLFATSFLLADETPLAEAMSDANQPYKSIRRGKSATWAEKLEWAQNLATSFEKSAAYLPEGLEDPKEIAVYKQMIFQSLAEMYTLQLAALNKDAKAYDDSYAKIKEIKSDGHDRFIEE